MAKKITKESYKSLELIFNSIPSGVFMVDLKNRITSWSRGAERLTGIKSKNAKGKKCTDIWLSPSCFKKCSLYSKNVKKPIYGKECEVVIKRKKFIISKNVDFLRDEKKHIIGGLETFEDITERKKTEELLGKTEERYRTQFEKALDAIFIADTKTGIIIDCNPAAEKLIGRKKAELVGQHQRILHPKEVIVGGFGGTFKQHVREKGRRASENLIITKKGQIRNVVIKANIFEVQGRKLMQGTFYDITESKKLEEALKNNELRFRELFRNISSGVAVYEAVENGRDFIFKDFNLAAERMEKTSKKQILNKKVTEVFPGVKEFGLFDVFKRVWKTGKPEHHPVSLYKDNKIFGWRENYVYKLPTGEVVAVYNDVTERKKADEKIRLLSSVVEQSSDGIATADMNGKLTFMNKAYLRMHGYKDIKELIGQNLKIFHNQEQIKKEVIPFLKQMMEQGFNKGEVGHLRKDGTIFSADMTTTIIKNEIGDPIAMAATARDITERKKAEEVQKQTYSLLRATLESTVDGILVVDTSGKVTSYNKKFGELWHIPQRLLDTHDDKKLLSFVLDQIVNPGVFLAKVRKLYSQNHKESFDIIEFKDGRVFERYSQPQKIEGKIAGRVWSFRDVTERKKAEELIKANEQRQRLIFQTTPEAMYITDLNGNFIEANNRTAWMHRYKNLSEFLNLRKTFFDLIVPAERKLARKDIQKCIKEGYLEYAKYRTMGKHGEIFFMEMSASVIDDTSGKPAEIIIVSRDITWRMQLEHNLKERVAERNCLYNISKLVNITDIPLEEVLKKAVNLIPFCSQNSENICAQIFYKNQKFQTDNFKKTKMKQSVNIIVNKKPVGTVEIFYFKEKIDITSLIKDEKSFLTAVAERLGEIINLRMAADNLLASEKKHRELFQTSMDGIVLTDMQGRILDANPSYLNMLGYTMREIRKMTYHQITPKKWHKFESEIVREQFIKRGYSDEYEKEYISKPGVVFPISIRGWLVKDEKGCPAGMWKIVRDIGARKKAQEALRVSEGKHRLIYETSGDAIMTLEPPSWKFTSGNPAIVKMFGVKNEKEFISLTPWQVSPKYQPDGQLSEVKAAEMIGIAMKKGSNFFEWTHKKVTGEEFFATVLLNRVGFDHRAFLQARVSDITERKKAEDALQKSERFLSDVLSSIQDGISVLDKDMIVRHVNDVIKRWYAPNLPLEGKKCYHCYHNASNPCHPCPVLRCFKTGHTEYDIVPGLPGSSIEWIELFAYPIKDPKTGKVEGVVEFVRDITARRKARMELESSEKRYRDITLSMSDYVWEIDTNGRYTYCSEQVEKIMGYSVKEMLGKSPFELMPPDETARSIRMFNNLKSTGQPLKDIVTWSIRKDGQAVCLLTNGVPLLASDGNLTGFRGVDKDITERKQAEDLIIKSLQEKELLLQEIQHRVKNNLQVITSLMHMQSKKIADPEIRTMFKEAMSRISTMSLIHSFLYKGGDVSHVNMREFIEELVRSLIVQYSLGKMKLSYSVDIGDIWFSINFSMPCGLIINELVTNSLKYAFAERETGNIKISFAGSKDNEIILTVSDDGAGMPEGFDISKSKTLGYRLIKILSEVQLKGSFEVNSGKKGTTVIIKFKKGD